MARNGDRITGLMSVGRDVANEKGDLMIELLEGLGGGSGEVLMKNAYRESIARGGKGALYLEGV